MCLSYHINAIYRAQLKALILGVQNDVYHAAHFRRYYVISADKCDALLEPLLIGGLGALYTGLDHIAGHQLEPLLQMLTKFGVRPVQIPDE